jgi:hypothetical protein
MKDRGYKSPEVEKLPVNELQETEDGRRRYTVKELCSV